MTNCKYCYDTIEEWNKAEPHPLHDHKGICRFCQFEVDDDDKMLAKMEYNHDIGAPDKALERQFQRYLNG